MFRNTEWSEWEWPLRRGTGVVEEFDVELVLLPAAVPDAVSEADGFRGAFGLQADGRRRSDEGDDLDEDFDDEDEEFGDDEEDLEEDFDEDFDEDEDLDEGLDDEVEEDDL